MHHCTALPMRLESASNEERKSRMELLRLSQGMLVFFFVRTCRGEEREKEKEKEKKKIHANYLRAMTEYQELQQNRNFQFCELTKGISFFKERLGLEFVCVDAMLHISFIYIDPQAPQRKFSFLLHVDENGQYQGWF